MTKIRTIIMVCAIFIFSACSDDKAPVVTYMPDGSIHIDRLDPGESVEIEIEMPIPLDQTLREMAEILREIEEHEREVDRIEKEIKEFQRQLDITRGYTPI